MDMKKRVCDDMAYQLCQKMDPKDSDRWMGFKEALEDLVVDIVLSLAEEMCWMEWSEDDIEKEVCFQAYEVRIENNGWSKKQKNKIVMAYGLDEALELLRKKEMPSSQWNRKEMVRAILQEFLKPLDIKRLGKVAQASPRVEVAPKDEWLKWLKKAAMVHYTDETVYEFDLLDEEGVMHYAGMEGYDVLYGPEEGCLSLFVEKKDGVCRKQVCFYSDIYFDGEIEEWFDEAYPSDKEIERVVDVMWARVEAVVKKANIIPIV